MSEGVIAPALVYCNCTKPKTGKDADEANFEIYQYLTVDPNGQRNIFCTDYPFVFENDCKPYINITPFPICMSNYYEEAVKNLEAYAARKYLEASEKGRTAEAVMWGKQQSDFHNAYTDGKNLYKSKQKYYKCLLQVLDRWFNTTEENVNTYFCWSRETRETLNRIENTFLQVIQKARKKLKDSQPGIIEEVQESFNNTLKVMKNFIDYIDVDLRNKNTYIDWKKWLSDMNSAWNIKVSDPLPGFDRAAKDMLNIIDLLSDMVCDELFFTDNQELISKSLNNVKKVFQSFYETISVLISDNDLDFRKTLEQFKTDLDGLTLQNKEQKEDKAFVDEDSFLVCRCGGIIRVVFDGQDMKKHLENLRSNIIDILKSAEKDFYEKYNKDKTENDFAFSMRDGYNFVRYVLLLLGEKSRYEEFYGMVDDNKILFKFGVEMNILIRPRSVINKNEHTEAAMVNIFKFILGKYKKTEKVAGYLFNTTALIDDLNLLNGGAEVSLILSDFAKGKIQAAGEAGGYLFDLKDIAEIIKDLCYASVADYVGEIQVSFGLGAYDIIYKRTYDFYGFKNQESLSSVIRHKGGVNNADQVYIKYFDNAIKVDCMLIIDGEKTREKTEYFVDNQEDGGIHENKD